MSLTVEDESVDASSGRSAKVQVTSRGQQRSNLDKSTSTLDTFLTNSRRITAPQVLMFIICPSTQSWRPIDHLGPDA